MARPDICDRAFEFARRIGRLSDRVANGGFVARRIAGQLFDAAASVGANLEEAQAAQTKPDFVAKLSLSRKEAHEARYWLRLLVATDILRSEHIVWELQESNELVAILTASVRTAQQSPRRTPSAERPAQPPRAEP